MNIQELITLLENSLIALNSSLGTAERTGNISTAVSLQEEINKNTETLEKLKTLL